jgi:predicted nucleotidyltransferase
MTPSALRSILQSFLDGSTGLPELVQRLRALGSSPSCPTARRVTGLIDAAMDVLEPDPTNRWTANLDVVIGLTRELLDSLPNQDELPSVEDVLTELRRQNSSIIAEYGIELLGLGGSVATGDATLFSDIDVAARCHRKVNLFDLAGATVVLSDILGRSVDLVMLDSAEPAFRERFSRTILPLEARVA